MEEIEKIREVTENEPAYPSRLRPLKDMPKLLYYRGSLPEEMPTAAIVGSRLCDYYGHMQAFEFGRALAAAGVQIVSGMAVGVDSYALEGALHAGGKVAAVLGCGVDICYPQGNEVLYREIMRRGGILSELPPGTPPLRCNFPLRNRIISALADIVLVIEAKMKSGSLITADFALEQGRTVFALPGRVGDALSDGCNYLIAQGAGIAYSPEAILAELHLTDGSAYDGSRRGRNDFTSRGGRKNARPVLPPGLSEKAVTILGRLSKDPVSLDVLIRGGTFSIEETASALVELEISGLVFEVSRHLYART